MDSGFLGWILASWAFVRWNMAGASWAGFWLPKASWSFPHFSKRLAAVSPLEKPGISQKSISDLKSEPLLPNSVRLHRKYEVQHAGTWTPIFKWDRFVPTSFSGVNGGFFILEKPGIGWGHGSGSKSIPLRGNSQANQRPDKQTETS